MASVCLSLLLWPAAVLPSARVVGRRRLALSTAAALSAATLRPRRAAADRGKDLYTSDGALLQSGGGVVQDALLPQFDSSGALIVGNGYSEETAYRTVRSGPASVEVLKGWVSTDAGGLRDPVTGSAASLVRMSALPTGASSIAELGKPEQLQLVSSLGLEAGLAKADLVAAARRTADGVVFYDYDLALPATKCDDTLAAACLPSLVVLLSACVRDRQLHVLRVDASPDEWRRAGKALKALRSTFAVAAS
mmetsp:Transcript_41977/g.132623  ORF Transcript_41977/g.132623 Transcript_41977/m.132623 type:complete len:250 (+) Transcript_41977:52-801(+)